MNVLEASSLRSVFKALFDVMKIPETLDEVECLADGPRLHNLRRGTGDEFISRYIANSLRHKGSRSGNASTLAFFAANCRDFADLVQRGEIMSYKTHLRHIFQDFVPGVELFVCVRRKSPSETKLASFREARRRKKRKLDDKGHYLLFYKNEIYPQQEIGSKEYEVIFELAVLNPKQLVQLFCDMSADHKRMKKVDMHVDDLRLTESGPSNYTVYTTRYIFN